MSDDVSKLPKWAQSKIRQLEDDVARLTDEIYAYHSGDGLVVYGLYEPRGNVHALPDHTTVMFISGDGEDRKCYVTVHRDLDGTIVVSSERRIYIEPRASNTIYVYPETREERYK